MEASHGDQLTSSQRQNFGMRVVTNRRPEKEYPLLPPHNFAIDRDWYEGHKDLDRYAELQTWYKQEDPDGFGANARKDPSTVEGEEIPEAQTAENEEIQEVQTVEHEEVQELQAQSSVRHKRYRKPCQPENRFERRRPLRHG